MSIFGDVLGSIIGGSGQSKAAKIQAQTTDKIIAANNANQNYVYGLEAPTIDRGNAASAEYSGLLGLTGSGTGTSSTDWTAYVDNNPDLLNDYLKNYAHNASSPYQSIAAYGQYHYNTYGKNEGRDISAYTTSSDPTTALDTFRNSSGYQDLLNTGLASVNSNAYAKGLGDSGATLKALQAKGTALADQSQQSYLSNLGTLINAGQTATGTVAGNATSTTAANNASLQTNAAAAGTAAVNTANSWANTATNTDSLISKLASSF